VTVDLELGDIQGNVLRGYRFPHAAFVALTIRRERAGRRLLAALHPLVTDARTWHGDGPDTTLNLAISHQGLRRLGVAGSVLESFPAEFAQGMAVRAGHLGDLGASAPERWERGLRPGQIDILVMLQAGTESLLRKSRGHLLGQLGHGVAVAGCEEGRALWSDAGWPREHFGYRDGISQPAIRGISRSDITPPLEPGEFVLGYRDEDGGLPEAPIPPFGRNGTFMVYRKLAQDVEAFRRLLRTAADEHFDGDTELVAAKLAGRWRDGAPAALRPWSSDGAGPLNDFLYGGDPRGRACPLGAHVRRANPRDGLPGGPSRTRRHRILRRGMTYGPASPPYRRWDRGLLFVCFNASLARQFEVVNRWLGDGDVFGLGREPDVIAGTRDRGTTVRMTVPGDPPVLLEVPDPMVRTRGGEYLFLPGLTAIKALS
jgi:Dyp-type peroxidase family